MQIDAYFQTIIAALQEVQKSERTAMERVATLFAETIRAGRTIFISGCSHSSIFAQEVFYRAGGLMLMNPLFLPGMTLEMPPATRTTRFERISGIAEAVLEESPIIEGDVLVLASISGRNAVPIEMAQWARERGIRVVALTSMRYGAAVTSRHASGKRLFELADEVLDVQSPPGDAVLDIPGLPVRSAPSSTVVGVTMLHAVISEAIEKLLAMGITPPVFVSANVEGGDELNARLLAEYRDRIHYM